MTALTLLAAAWLCASGAADFTLPDRVIVASGADPAEEAAGKILVERLHAITGVAELTRLAGGDATPAHAAIFVGHGPWLAERWKGVDLATLGDEGYVLQPDAGGSLLVAGGKPRGTLYAAYALLERLGFRAFTARCVLSPGTAVLTGLPVREMPKLEYREPYFAGAFDLGFAVPNRANGTSMRLGPADGGKVSYSHFVHTLYSIVPPEKYFAEHPEYFALVGGKRASSGAQLCLTSPDVLRIAVDTVKRWMRESPEATIFSVSQNDCFGPCECDACRAIDDREGSHSGTMLEFVNKVAEAIEADFPDKVVDTLAYQYTRKPPRTVRPRKNVIVRLCSIECCFSHPLESCPKNAAFRDDLVGWSKLTDRLYVWDYVTNFANYLSPFPNTGVLAQNIRFYAEHGVRGIFEEGNDSPGAGAAEMNDLKTYVLARALWDPSIDGKRARDEFLDGYYGPSAPPIRAWLDRLDSVVRERDIHAFIYDKVGAAYLDEDTLRFGDERFADAERLSAAPGADSAVRERVRAAALSLRWVRLQRASAEERAKLLPAFAADMRAAGIAHVSEGGTLEEFLKRSGA